MGKEAESTKQKAESLQPLPYSIIVFTISSLLTFNVAPVCSKPLQIEMEAEENTEFPDIGILIFVQVCQTVD
jgi:hypothetical protein